MKFHSRTERGQALVFVALAIIGLVGITGLAIDGSIILADRRHAQNAADTSALAGALAKVKPPIDPITGNPLDPWTAMQNAAHDRAESNGYTNNLITSTVEVYTCDEAGASCPAPYNNDDPEDYVQVIITSHVDTFFARVLGIETLTNSVQAIALSHEDGSGPLGNGEAIVSYAPGCENPLNFTVAGNAIVNVTGGGLFVNNTEDGCGFVCTSTGAEITGDITTAGGIVTTSDHCGENIDGTISEGTGSVLDFPVTLEDIGMEIPPECDDPVGSYTNYEVGDTLPATVAGYDYVGKGTVPVTVLHPGRYGQFPPPKDSPSLALKDTMLMEPGTYCVSDAVRWNQDKFVLVGEDVTIFIRAGYEFHFNGGVIDIDAPDSGPLAGYVLVVEPDYGDPLLSANPGACDINGNTLNDYEGTIFAPYCDCTIDGGSEPSGFNAQVLCYTVKITGDSIIDFNYDPGVNGMIVDPPKTGVAK